ncbi:hypothetical protein AC230_04260 [Streptomyces caatingaensis]|uniref:Uncharacterized protein n=1 Tax=Streptomyces caatingaensis TaxID=1678637 RepID=A0A0K9XNH6_9ACTN|nr:hypothetical protein [Streptomyces caatingaensis]KNB54242.1 hypothetical protein AC230_04260 [Streptomyces caatingaensis]
MDRLRRWWGTDGRRPAEPDGRTAKRSGRDGGAGGEERAGRSGRSAGKHPNLFEAAAAYIAACAENDQDSGAEAARWVSPEALGFGVNELACRAVRTLAREHGTSPREVARSLLGLPRG